MKFLLLDNYDSFTYNLFQLLSTFSSSITVLRNDETDIRQIEDMQPDLICISPGPKDPAHAGMSIAVIREFAGRIPLFGVCLGMQCINEVYGGITVHAPVPVHGKTSAVYHEGTGMFRGIPAPFRAARYHSLKVSDMSSELIATAHSEDGVVMALQHKDLPVFGVQYHPESFMSEYGEALVANIIRMSSDA